MFLNMLCFFFFTFIIIDIAHATSRVKRELKNTFIGKKNLKKTKAPTEARGRFLTIICSAASKGSLTKQSELLGQFEHPSLVQVLSQPNKTTGQKQEALLLLKGIYDALLVNISR